MDVPKVSLAQRFHCTRICEPVRPCCVVPSRGSVEAAREGEGALAACSRGLLSWDLSEAPTDVAVVVVCLLRGRRNVADRVTWGLDSDG